MRPLISEIDTNLNRLGRHIERLIRVNDTMFGARPPQTEKQGLDPAPYGLVSELQMQAQTTARMIDRLGEELERLEDGLYLREDAPAPSRNLEEYARGAVRADNNGKHF